MLSLCVSLPSNLTAWIELKAPYYKCVRIVLSVQHDEEAHISLEHSDVMKYQSEDLPMVVVYKFLLGDIVLTDVNHPHMV